MDQLKAELIDRLKDAGLENINLQHSKATRKTIVAMEGTRNRADRNNIMDRVVKKLQLGSYVKIGGGGEDLNSIEFKDSGFEGFTVLLKPEGINLSTAEAETLQAYFVIEKFNNPTTRYTFENFNLYNKMQFNTSINLPMLLEKANATWLNSSKLGAEALYKFIKGRHKDYIVCHPSKGKSHFYKSLYDSAKFLKEKVGQKTMQLDKWNPGDIWLVHQRFIGHDFKQYKDITSLNAFLLDQYKKQNIIGVSLKLLVRTPIMETNNDDQQRPLEVKFSRLESGTDFLENNKGIVIYNNNKKMDFRSFITASNENILGEIQGVTAQGGKIGHGGLINVFGKIFTHNKDLLRKYDSMKDKTEIGTDIFNRTQKIKNSLRLTTKYKNADDYIAYLDKRNDIRSGWLISKFQVIEMFEQLSKLMINRKKLDDKLLEIVAYAASRTDISSVFLKMYN